MICNIITFFKFKAPNSIINVLQSLSVEGTIDGGGTLVVGTSDIPANFVSISGLVTSMDSVIINSRIVDIPGTISTTSSVAGLGPGGLYVDGKQAGGGGHGGSGGSGYSGVAGIAYDSYLYPSLPGSKGSSNTQGMFCNYYLYFIL